MKKLPINNNVIKGASCLNPQTYNINKWPQVVAVAQKMPNISPEEIDNLADEWKCLSSHISKVKVYEYDDNGEKKYRRIDEVWKDILKDAELPSVEKVVKTTLIVPHGNSDVERGFSINRDIMGTNRSSLSINSLNGLRLAKDAVNRYGTPQNVPRSKKMIQAVSSARTTYENRLQEERDANERRKKEAEKKKAENEAKEKECKLIAQQNKSLKEQESDLLKKEEMIKDKYQVGKDLVEDGTRSLNIGISEKNMAKISKAQILIETGQKQMQEAESELEDINRSLKTIGEKRSTLLDSAYEKDLLKYKKNAKKNTSHSSKSATASTSSKGVTHSTGSKSATPVSSKSVTSSTSTKNATKSSTSSTSSKNATSSTKRSAIANKNGSNMTTNSNKRKSTSTISSEGIKRSK